MIKMIAMVGLLMFAASAHAAEIIRIGKGRVLVQFDSQVDEFVVGDQVEFLQEGLSAGSLQVLKVKGRRFLAKVLNGNPAEKDVIGRTLVSAAGATAPSATLTGKDQIDPIAVTLVGTSNVVWRGLVTNKNSTINASLDYYWAETGLALGLFVAPGLEGFYTSEADLTVSYSGKFGTLLDYSLGTTRYMYMDQHGWDFFDHYLEVTYGRVSVLLSVVPQYFNQKTAAFMERVSFYTPFLKRYRLIYAFAWNSFGAQDQVFLGSQITANYVDYKLGMRYTTRDDLFVEVAFTGTNRTLPGGARARDEAVGVKLSKTFY